MLGSLFSILCIIVAILLVAAIVVQNSKGGGFNSAFGASNISAMIGNRKVDQGIERITWYLGGLLMGLAFLSAVFTSNRASNISNSKLDQAFEGSNAPAPKPATQAPGLQPEPPANQTK